MLLRYLRMNLRLFGSFGLVALPVMLPLNAQACNRMWRRLQPYVVEAATVCSRGCNRM